MMRKKILVADDSQTFLMYFGILLKRMGFTVVPAENGLEVLKLLKFVEPDIIMLDVKMDIMDGITVLRYIKADKKTSRIPVIMISGDSRTEFIKKCRALGCASYLVKPVNIDMLHKALEECIFFSKNEKRENIRAYVNKKVFVAHNGRQYELYTESLSETGIYIRKKDPFPVGSELEITLHLGDVHPVCLKGNVVYVKGVFDSLYNIPPGMGIQFREITDDQVKLLRNYVEKLIAEDIFDSQEETVIEKYEDKTEIR